MMLSAEHIGCLPDFFADIPDPRRGQGQRHLLPAVLAIAAGATLCGICSCKAIQPVGPGPRSEGSGALSLLLPRPPLRGSQSHRHPQGAHPGGP
jgi:hypothetical protein